MILREATIKYKGYDPDTLSLKSRKRICCSCDNCGRVRWVMKGHYRDLCKSCAQRGKTLSEEHKRKMSEANKGRTHSEESKRKMSEAWKGRIVSEETRRKMSEAKRGKTQSEETRIKMSAAQQGIPVDEWKEFATEQTYCYKFNDACRERNRNKYDRRSFVSGIPESRNVTSTGKQKRLTVHHVDMNKSQGCDDHEWSLVPVLLTEHGLLHTDLWKARLQYLLEHVWYPDGVWNPDF